MRKNAVLPVTGSGGGGGAAFSAAGLGASEHAKKRIPAETSVNSNFELISVRG
jgi:hypothetical protein